MWWWTLACGVEDPAETVAATPPVVLASVATPAVAAPPTGPVWELEPDPEALLVVVRFDRSTLGADVATDHVVSAGDFLGEVVFDPRRPERCRIAVDVPTAALRVDTPEARARVSLPVVEGIDRQGIADNLHSARQLHSAMFPAITFRSTDCRREARDSYLVAGELTVHGVTAAVEVPMTIRVEDDVLVARGTFLATHADFGMEPFSAALGALRNADPLEFFVDVTASAGDPSPER